MWTWDQIAVTMACGIVVAIFGYVLGYVDGINSEKGDDDEQEKAAAMAP